MVTSAHTRSRGEPDILLDLSRLLSRVLHHSPTGVDRVEMAYARGLIARVPERLKFVAVHPWRRYGRLSTDSVLRFLDETERQWEYGAEIGSRHRHAFRSLRRLYPWGAPSADARRRIYIQSSPHHLIDARLVDGILRRENASWICLVHDLIPLEFPEYSRPTGEREHRRRIDTIASLARGIVANSHATMNAIQPWLKKAGSPAQLRVAHLGTHPFYDEVEAAPQTTRPYFLCIGTIEPRKNHLLLLNVWRSLAERFGAANTPRLVLVGRRGWENEQVIDMLDRSPALADCVEERGPLSDRETQALLHGAQALLLPSFAEGYGMPVAEALDLGVPVICSELNALREAGQGIPDYIDPLDGVAWRNAVLEYALPGSPRRALQMERLQSWRTPTWKDHMDVVLDLVGELER